ncbi:MAG TPA: carbonic anhydrase [Methylomirabilota bacterium]|nr:carbonic anhydrase [Methylomirabilota bacterium]
MRKLVEGIHRFQQGVFGPQRDLFRRLIDGQEPDALFITCSDSRIVPNLITQTQPGELFIIRNAGNIVPPWGVESGEAGTLEYAVEALTVSDIIVCGHTHCGAMKAVIDPSQTRELPALASWLRHCEGTRRILSKAYADLTGDDLVETAVAENVLVQIEHLRTHPSVMAALARSKVTLHAWVYNIAEGEVYAFEPDIGQYVPIEEAGRGTRHEPTRLSRRQI